VPQLARLRGERGDEVRMGMTERIDGDAGGKIEIAVAVGCDQPNAFAPLEGEGNPRRSASNAKSRRQARTTGGGSALQIRAAKMKRAASPGGTAAHCISGWPPVNTA